MVHVTQGVLVKKKNLTKKEKREKAKNSINKKAKTNLKKSNTKMPISVLKLSRMAALTEMIRDHSDLLSCLMGFI
jgi:hypothetical protein